MIQMNKGDKRHREVREAGAEKKRVFLSTKGLDCVSCVVEVVVITFFRMMKLHPNKSRQRNGE